MLLTVGDKQYAVHFQHSPAQYFESGVISSRATTDCAIHEGRCTVKGCAAAYHKLRGISIVHPGDHFDKRVGRKISLGRALQSLPRETRRLIWTEYFKICPHK